MAKEINNHLYPFFWQHGESEETLTHYMDKIYESGMRAVCVEARPHPEFVSDGWWHDMEIILKKAREYQMKVWILDDSHFPTGYANGRIEKDFPQYRKLYLYQRRFDFAGPMRHARINASHLTGRPWEKPGLGDKEIVGVYMAKRTHPYTESTENMDAVDADSIVELEGSFKDDIITLDVPTGNYSVFVVFTTRKGGEKATENYLNPLVAEATRVLIDEVYEPHYEHFSADFGKTIQAFFSDEPRFGNIKGPNAKIGTDMVLPWRPGLQEELPFEKKFLPLLWVNANGAEHEIRYQYMDLVTKLYSENFSGVLAAWCNSHGVSYLGHNIEDEGAHCRLGYGPGHYFRAQKMQDYAGVDIIGTQIVPGMPYHHDAFSTGGNNGEFYHYALCKLAGSAAHLDPKKKGRAMCEAFGAYGWNEGLKMMKWLTDHMVSRGINNIVPHAFDPKDFPDWDCPPHFYAHGNNPQFRYFPVFTAYANRLLELFSGGKTAAKIGVLYPGALEWYGGAMPIEKVLRELCENQLDADIISEDYLKEAELKDGKYIINDVAFEVLIIPEAASMPAEISELVDGLKRAGVRVIWLGRDAALHDLARACEDYREVFPEHAFRELAYYHYKRGGKDICMFFNESVSENVDMYVEIPASDSQKIYRYDAFSGRYESVSEGSECIKGLQMREIRICLSPYESAVYILSEEEIQADMTDRYSFGHNEKRTPLHGQWKISYADALSYPDFTQAASDTGLQFLSDMEGYEDKAGTVSYETVFERPDGDSHVFIDLGVVYETAEVFLNGRSAGVKIAPPYRFDITQYLKKGENHLRIEITNTLGTQVRDGLSQYLLIEPFGMENDPEILTF